MTQMSVLKMSASLLSRAKHLGVFILGRFPFLNALILMMALGERAPKDNNVPPYPAEILYAFIIIMVLLGVAISYEFGRFHGSVAYIVMIAYSAYAIYTNEKLGYSAWLKNRLICRAIGLMGVYTIYAFLTSREKNRTVQKIGEGLLAVYTMTYMYILVNSPEDRGLFVDRIVFKEYSLFFLVTVMGACAMIYVQGGLFVTDASQAIMCINLALFVCIDVDLEFWTRKRGVPYWVQIKILSDDLNISVGLFVMAFANWYWKTRLPKEDKDGRLYHHDHTD